MLVRIARSHAAAAAAPTVGVRRLSGRKVSASPATNNLGFRTNRVGYAAAAAAAAASAAAVAASAEGNDAPAFHFGLIADVQVRRERRLGGWVTQEIRFFFSSSLLLFLFLFSSLTPFSSRATVVC